MVDGVLGDTSSGVRIYHRDVFSSPVLGCDTASNLFNPSTLRDQMCLHSQSLKGTDRSCFAQGVSDDENTDFPGGTLSNYSPNDD
eukprot:3102710-Amphidinium_carterae.1